MPEHGLIIIGAGPGGYVAAIRAAQLGFNVACVEEDSVLGGTCLRIGCIPSKALLESSQRFREVKEDFGKHGIRASEITLDLGAMLQRKVQVVSTLTRGVESLFKKNKITRYLGRGRIDGAARVIVNSFREETELRAKSIIIATGSKPATLQGIEL